MVEISHYPTSKVGSKGHARQLGCGFVHRRRDETHQLTPRTFGSRQKGRVSFPKGRSKKLELAMSLGRVVIVVNSFSKTSLPKVEAEMNRVERNLGERNEHGHRACVSRVPHLCWRVAVVRSPMHKPWTRRDQGPILGL
jgi:hypothetical protein